MSEEEKCKGVVWPGQIENAQSRLSSSQCARRLAAFSVGKDLLQSQLTLEITSSKGLSCGNRGGILEIPATKTQGTL